MSDPIDIQVPATVAAPSARANLKKLRWDVPDGALVRLHFNPFRTFVSPWFIAAVAAWALDARRRGCTFEVVHAPMGEIGYMWRMGLHEYLGIEPKEWFGSEHEPTGRFVPLRQVRNHAELNAASDDILPLVHGAGREEWMGALKHIYSELLRNVLEHSGSEDGAVICAQWYPSRGYVQVAVADSGIGIRSSLAATHHVETDQHAILLAMRPGVTGTAPIRTVARETQASDWR